MVLVQNSGFEYDKEGPIQLSVLNNVRFARLMLTGFDQTSTLSFGTMDLVRSDWRKYTSKIASLMFLEIRRNRNCK
jgi:cell surface protein SprA